MNRKVFQEDTIAALITPPGEGGVAVIRLSGPDAFTITDQVFKTKARALCASLESHTIHLGTIYRTETAEEGTPLAQTVKPPQEWVLDQALLSIFRAPHSYTGENVTELSLHGGMALSAKVLELILSRGARFAQPGEFTRRAFLNNKIDLTQAEAVQDLIKSKSDISIRTAIGQLQGGLSQRFKALKENLMKLYAHMEAFLDFPEEDLEVYSDGEMLRGMSQAREVIQALIDSFKRGALLREGAKLVIAGKPNVGKSSLFNALLERDRALVSEYAGTTRDTLEEWLEVKGLAVRLSDTAGLMQNAAHPLDAMGVERTKKTLQEASAYLFVVDATRPLEPEDQAAWLNLQNGRPIVGILHKADLGVHIKKDELAQFAPAFCWLEVSSKKRTGLEQVEEKIFEVLAGTHEDESGEQITRLRHKSALEAALAALKRSEKAFHERASLELVTLDLKIAIDSLRELIGEIYSEDLLDVIFSEFCIGK